MKNTDHSFKLVAAIVLAGVVVAFAGPNPASRPSAGTTVTTITAAHADNHDTSANTGATE